MLRVVAAGAPITATAYHCATVGAGAALAEADRINAAHWRAAKAGKPGWRRPDMAPGANIVALPPMAVAPAHVVISDGLDIPAFLQRRPLSRLGAIARSARRVTGTRHDMVLPSAPVLLWRIGADLTLTSMSAPDCAPHGSMPAGVKPK